MNIAVDTGYLLWESHPLPSGGDADLYCSKICTQFEWCNLWCPHPFTIPTHCSISNLFIMPTFMETDSTTTLTCYTGRHKDLATNAKIRAGEQNINPFMFMMKKENLIDGIYNYDINECFATKVSDNHRWFVLDFNQTVTFSHVILVALPRNNSYKFFNAIEVRVGNKELSFPTGYEEYDLFGVFPGSSYPNQVVGMQSPTPVSAQFVFVQKASDENYGLRICHIEVY
ncbi:hypothetical protein Pcinc_019506 [Petrolisthes cinctipes]|uniref:F5/8 type C domain-containing protein n=1 Tax=Petrolisthes cinctipes TaxID=88211 RepID=A0AAE1KKB3_PETCI|nr:hypothetical protein Pcinc_019506 [Petrolisthes cinctipes]